MDITTRSWGCDNGVLVVDDSQTKLEHTHCLNTYMLDIVMEEGFKKKNTDFYFTRPPIHNVWNKAQHFGLTLAFCFPLLSHSTFRFRHQAGLDKVEGEVLRLWERNNGTEGSILCQLCREAWGL